jgi:hypothetical protein
VFVLRRWALVPVLLGVAACATFLQHGQTLHYGFHYDDYHFVRPFPRSEIAAAFHGPWDPAGIEVPFYRPLTIVFYALRFEVLGLNAVAYHTLSLALFACAAALCGWIVFRFTARPLAGIAGVVLFVVHPAMPYALVAWVTNQMHLVEVVVVLGALAWWDAVRRRGAGWWLPLLLFATVAFLIKEDGVMLLPAIVVVHEIRRRLAEPDVPGVPLAFLALSVVLVLGLLTLRSAALGGLGGYSRPTASVAWANFSKGLDGVLRLVPAHRPWQLASSWFVVALPITALAMWRGTPPGARACLLSGIAVVVLFNLPFVFVSKVEQMHLVAFGAVLILAASTAAVVESAPGHPLKTALAAVIVAGIAALASVSRDISTDFEPFGPLVLSRDRIVEEWGAVPDGLRRYLAQKRATVARRPSSNPADAVDHVAFGTHLPEVSPSGVRYQWMAGTRSQILISDAARHVAIPLRHSIDSFRQPMRVTVSVDGRRSDEFWLDTTDWRVSRFALRPGGAPRPGRMHRVVISIDRAWNPSETIPGSSDTRWLGLQIGEIEIR